MQDYEKCLGTPSGNSEHCKILIKMTRQACPSMTSRVCALSGDAGVQLVYTLTTAIPLSPLLPEGFEATLS
jgi:hypothetical protein